MQIFGRHIHNHRKVRSNRSGIYYECACGHRKVSSYIFGNGGGGHTPPVNQHWLNGGDWDYIPPWPKKMES